MMMMAMMMAMARLSSCFPRWLLGQDRPESAALAGALAGLASFNYRFLFPYSSSRGLSPADFLCFCLSWPRLMGCVVAFTTMQCDINGCVQESHRCMLCILEGYRAHGKLLDQVRVLKRLVEKSFLNIIHWKRKDCSPTALVHWDCLRDQYCSIVPGWQKKDFNNFKKQRL